MRDDTKPEKGKAYVQADWLGHVNGWEQDEYEPMMTCGRILLIVAVQGFAWFAIGLALGLWL